MNHPPNFIKHFILISCYIISFFSYATNSKLLESQANSSIKILYHKLNAMPNTPMPERIEWISRYFLGSIYELGSLGEGVNARYDQFPQYRVDAFDCDTYVNTVMSLALAESLKYFKQCLKLIRYKNGRVTYLTRNHFTSIDWNKNNQKQGILQDITLKIKNKKNQSIALFTTTLINKPSWYAHKSDSAIRLQTESKVKQERLLDELKAKGSRLEVAKATIPYLPFTALFFKNNKPNLYLFSQIPNGAIIEIVRPNWDLRQYIGTFLDVSHLGFAIKKDNQLYFRQASSIQGKVVDTPLIDYLISAKKSATIKGINLQIIVPKKPLNEGCKL